MQRTGLNLSSPSRGGKAEKKNQRATTSADLANRTPRHPRLDHRRSDARSEGCLARLNPRVGLTLGRRQSLMHGALPACAVK
jgi:hypothetical protein